MQNRLENIENICKKNYLPIILLEEYTPTFRNVNVLNVQNLTGTKGQMHINIKYIVIS